MDKFLEKYNLSKLNQEEVENSSGSITSTKVKTVIKNHQEKPRTRWLHRQIVPKVREELTSILLKLLKISEEGTFLNSFYKVSITLISKPDKYTTKMKIENQYYW